MTALIIDDERRARAELRHLLQSHPEIEVIGEAENVTSALASIAALRPELLFLDIQMPGRDAFELIAHLPSPAPRVIFCTAFDQHALRAFEVNAVDYLLKPIAPERLAASLARLQLDTAPEPAAPPLEIDDRVLLRATDRSWFAPLKAIRVLESVGNYTRVFFDAESPLILRSLNALEARLPAAHFFRASRTHIVNVNHIIRVEDYFGGGLFAHLKGQEQGIEISRRRAIQFRKAMTL